jgi:hypothetical protein
MTNEYPVGGLYFIRHSSLVIRHSKGCAGMNWLRSVALAVLALRAVPMVAMEDNGRVLQTPIAPGLSISMDISTSSPYLGQQFSIVYSLVAQRFPTAVDVQPQQFSGFWTEIVPLPQEPRTIMRLVAGKPTHEFLLRQVIAYPVEEGELVLPPLAVKMMITGALAPGATNWDVEAATKPVPIQVQSLPASLGPEKPSYLVGTLSGRLRPMEGSDEHSFLLEMEGTANIAFIQPQSLLRCQGAVLLPPRLLRAESEVDTMGIGGRRKLTLVFHRTWAARLLPAGSETLHIDDIHIPVFQPEAAGWREAEVEGLSLHLPAGRGEGGGPSGMRRTEKAKRIGDFLKPYGIVLLSLLAGVAAAGMMWWFVWGRAARLSPEHWRVHYLGRLERQSQRAPRSFVETAHRFLERYAAENHLKARPGNEETPFDQCWAEIERCRFNGGEPPAGKREHILRLMQLMLKGEEASSGGEQR